MALQGLLTQKNAPKYGAFVKGRLYISLEQIFDRFTFTDKLCDGRVEFFFAEVVELDPLDNLDFFAVRSDREGADEAFGRTVAAI